MVKYVSVSIFLLALLSIAVGCAPDPKKPPPAHPVKGMVTLDGEPLKAGKITLEPEPNDGFGPASADIVDGKFTTNMRPTKVKVKISHMVDNGKKATTGEKMLDESIPEKYNAKTELTATIAAGDNDLKTFELKSK